MRNFEYYIYLCDDMEFSFYNKILFQTSKCSLNFLINFGNRLSDFTSETKIKKITIRFVCEHIRT